MAKGWIATSKALPEDGAGVSFLIENRAVWMSGTYRCGLFQSHWGSYEAGMVKCWRVLEDDGDALIAQTRQA